MNADEARDRFSDAVEGALTDDERAEFERALEGDPELRADFEGFETTVRHARGLADERPRADLVTGVQDRLRRRSRGRYYRDRFARRRPGQVLAPLLLAAVTLAAVVAAWWIVQGPLP